MKVLTNDEAVELMHCVHRDFEEFLRRLNRRLQTAPESLTPQAAFLAHQYEEVYCALNNNEAWKAYKFLDSESFTAVLKEYQKLCRNFYLNAFTQFPLEDFKVSEEKKSKM